jgi:3-hydroxyacyl-[acyl-carrier-protein] dehydratase
MSLEAIKAAIPHREPFLLLDEIVERTDSRIVCRRMFRGDEFWFAGHYPGFPLMPGVLLCEAAMQAGAVLLAQKISQSQAGKNFASTAIDIPSEFWKVPVLTRMNNVKFKHMVRPGDTAELVAEIKEQLAGTYFLAASVLLEGKAAVTFDFACKEIHLHE